MTRRDGPSGALRQRIALFARTETADDAGGVLVAHTENGFLWGRIESLDPQARGPLGRDGALADAAIRVRAGAVPALGSKLVAGARSFRLLAVREAIAPEATALLLVEEIE